MRRALTADQIPIEEWNIIICCAEPANRRSRVSRMHRRLLVAFDRLLIDHDAALTHTTARSISDIDHIAVGRLHHAHSIHTILASLSSSLACLLRSSPLRSLVVQSPLQSTALSICRSLPTSSHQRLSRCSASRNRALQRRQI